MTEQEYIRKREEYAQSKADKDVIDKAIRDLDTKWQLQKDVIVVKSKFKD